MAMVPPETSPPPAMNFNVPVKVTALVQLIVCFGIIASTVSITRSLTQSNVAKLNANVGHLHGPSGQVKSETFDYTKLHGYIVSNKERRYNSSKTVLHKLGLVSHQYVPLSYKSDTIRKAMEEFHVGNPKYLTDRYKKVFSNRMAFTHLFQEFVNDSQAPPASWRFFFEDDVALHPSLTEGLAQQVLAEGLEVAKVDGIVYLGICGPNRCQRTKVILASPVEARRCAGACTHAFGLTKWKTGEFLAYMDKMTPSVANAASMYFDQLLRTYGERVHRIFVLGSNLRSPQVGNHYGLVYQDRTKYPSVINSKEPKQ